VEACQTVGTLKKRLTSLKRKLEEMNAEEEKQVQRCKARLDHLGLVSVPEEQRAESLLIQWSEARVDRVIIDYMFRQGYYESAISLSREAGAMEFADADVFLRARRVIEDLRQKSCREALEWCSENKSRLRKIKSTLEFALRTQEFIELVRKEKFIEAIAYARKHFSSAAKDEQSLRLMQQAMATLAFRKDTQCSPYKELFDENSWQRLEEQFRLDNYLLHGMPPHPLIYITLQAGLSALKTQLCYIEEKKATECPVCDASFGQLAQALPFSQHFKSCIICSITGQQMDEHEHAPLVLPNGFVYSKKALEDMARQHSGQIVCPRTGAICSSAELKKAFIL